MAFSYAALRREQPWATMTEVRDRARRHGMVIHPRSFDTVKTLGCGFLDRIWMYRTASQHEWPRNSQVQQGPWPTSCRTGIWHQIHSQFCQSDGIQLEDLLGKVKSLRSALQLTAMEIRSCSQFQRQMKLSADAYLLVSIASWQSSRPCALKELCARE